jgi:hypothetical protein
MALFKLFGCSDIDEIIIPQIHFFKESSNLFRRPDRNRFERIQNGHASRPIGLRIKNRLKVGDSNLDSFEIIYKE